MWSPVYVELKKKKKQEENTPQTSQTHKYREQTGEACEGGAKAQTFGCKMSWEGSVQQGDSG